VARGVEVQDATSIVPDDKAVEEAKRGGRNCEQVHGGNRRIYGADLSSLPRLVL